MLLSPSSVSYPGWSGDLVGISFNLRHFQCYHSSRHTAHQGIIDLIKDYRWERHEVEASLYQTRIADEDVDTSGELLIQHTLTFVGGHTAFEDIGLGERHIVGEHFRNARLNITGAGLATEHRYTTSLS